MEVKPGYKQTEVGMIPEEWDLKPLGKLTEFVTSGSRGWAQFYSETGALFIRSQNVRDGRLTFDDVQFVSPPSGAEGNRTKVELNDLLITITGNSVGNVAVVEEQFDEAYISQHVGLVRLKEATLGPYVCRYLSPSSPGNPQIAGSQSGQSKPGLNLQNLRDFWIALPPTSKESEAIEKALSDVDGLLDGLDRLITKKRDLKQAAMQQLLTGQTRLPGFRGEWEVKRLGDCATIVMGQSPDSKNYNRTGEGIPLIQGNADIENRRSIARVWTTQITKEGSPGELLLTVRAPVGAVGRITDHCCLGRGVCAIRPVGDKNFLFHALVFAEPSWKILEQGTTFTSANSTQVAAFLVKVPIDIPEQSSIAEALSEMDAELAALEQRREKTRALKQAMMQELLTGRIRLVPPAANVIPADFKAPVPQAETKPASGKSHNWAINEAVVVAVLAKTFGSEKFPLGRKRCTKLSYLLHRHVEHVAEGYLKKAAGPYNPAVKYRGPEGIAQKNGYVRSHKNGHFSGYIAAEKIAQAEDYFQKWYGKDVLHWLEQFRHHKNDDLELLATVDMAMEELHRAGKEISLATVRNLIASEPEWVPKLDRAVFSDQNITTALDRCAKLFPR